MKSEKVITDPEAEVHRVVVDPAWVQDGVVSPQAFVPRPKDGSRLSCSDKGATAAEAYAAWMERFPRSRANACATVRVKTCLPLGLTVIDDSRAEELHVSVDYVAVTDWDPVAMALAARSVLWTHS